MSTPPPLEELPPPRYPTGEDTLLRKASVHLFISLFPSVSICLFAALWLEDAILPRLGYLKCGRYHENPLPCRLIPLPILLAISTFVFNISALYKLGMRKNPKSIGVSGAIASALAEEENRTRDERTPLPTGMGANDVGDGGTESLQPSSLPAPIPHDLLAWTALFSTLWTLLPLVSIVTGITQWPTWDPRDAEAWGVLVVLLTVQIWTTSIAAFAFARLRRMDVGHSEQGSAAMPPQIVPDTQTRVKLTHSLMLLALLPLIMLEGNVILFNLFIVSLILNIGVLTALDLRLVLRQSANIFPTRTLSQQAGEPTSYPLRRAFFTLISACTFILTLTWTSWFVLTVVSATLSMLRDTFPDWNVVHFPIPARGWEPSVWLESVADLWLGWTLGNVALCAWTESPRGGED